MLAVLIELVKTQQNQMDSEDRRLITRLDSVRQQRHYDDPGATSISPDPALEACSFGQVAVREKQRVVRVVPRHQFLPLAGFVYKNLIEMFR